MQRSVLPSAADNLVRKAIKAVAVRNCHTPPGNERDGDTAPPDTLGQARGSTSTTRMTLKRSVSIP
jgi:hypothetical protein